MSLRERANRDARRILRNTRGFTAGITLITPDGVTVPDLLGNTNNIFELIDPDTGQGVSSQTAWITIHLDDLIEAGVTDVPQAIQSFTSRPWIVQFTDAYGTSHSFKIIRSSPNRTLGTVTCFLGHYTP